MTCAEMQAHEERAFQTGATAEGLMEKVGSRMAGFLLEEFPRSGEVIAFLGKGHNAGDALVVARHLSQQGWQVTVRTPYAEEELAQLSARKLRELGEPLREKLNRNGPLLLLDGLVGLGARGPLREPLASLAEEMNELRRHGAITIAMDLPSGLDGDDGTRGAVVADYTLTVGIPKWGLVADSAIDFVGRLQLITVEELSLPSELAKPTEGSHLITGERVQGLLRRRPFSYHKGQAGRVAILAGSPGMWGAAVLCARGALRGGAGLVTLYVAEEWIAPLLPLVDPEVMIRPRPADWRTIVADALVVGPGLGQAVPDGERLCELLGHRGCQVVVDADALNLLAAAGRVEVVGKGGLLTPHPGEMARLCNATGTRSERARALAEVSGAAVLFKGARTLVTERERGQYYNTTGHPGMATGGQGDTLAGVLGALLAQGLAPLEAAQVGAWVCGRAAEFALRDGESAESLTPSALSARLGAAFRSARAGR